MTRPEGYSDAEWAKVQRFGFDQPEFDDSEGMTFGVRFVLGAIILVLFAAGMSILSVVVK